jgi:hypothetical protein
MMARVIAAARPVSRPFSRAVRIAIAICIGAVLCMVAAFVVWLVGFDEYWAVASVLAVVPVTAVLATLRFDEHAPWDPPARDASRGVQLAVPMIEASLAACDRLARPAFLRRMGAVLITERDDRIARANLVRRVRDLLTAELHDRGLDPATHADDVTALLGHDALAILQPTDDTPVTTAAIASCLDAVERLGTTTKRAQGAQ